MNEAAFQKYITDLLSEMGHLPPIHRKQLSALAEKTAQCHQDLKKSAMALQDSLDYLRVCTKYVMFDLEATRRENNYLRKLIQHAGDEGDYGRC